MQISTNYYVPNFKMNSRQQKVSNPQFKAGEGELLVKLLEENKGKLSKEQLNRFVDENFFFRSGSIKKLLEKPIAYIAGLAASIAALTAARTKLEDENAALTAAKTKLEDENANLTAAKTDLENNNAALTKENGVLRRTLQLEESHKISSKHSINDVLELINIFQELNINITEKEIQQVLDNGITKNDILKFYNLFDGENKDVKEKLANTFIKEWILAGVTYNDLDKFLNLPYCVYYDSGEDPIFIDDESYYAQGVNAKLLTESSNIKDMIYLSESKKLNLQYIYAIMFLVNRNQINLNDIKNMDNEELRKFCNQFDKRKGSSLWKLEEYLFHRYRPENDINWKEILRDKEYNEEHFLSTIPIRKIVADCPAFEGNEDLQRLISALLG